MRRAERPFGVAAFALVAETAGRAAGMVIGRAAFGADLADAVLAGADPLQVCGFFRSRRAPG